MFFVKSARICVALVGLFVLTAGSASSGMGSDEFESTIYQTYRHVKSIDDQVGGAVSELNTTTADLSARVDESDQKTRELQGLVAENTRKTAELQAQLASLTKNVCSAMNIAAAPAAPGITGMPSTAPSPGQPEAVAPTAPLDGPIGGEEAAPSTPTAAAPENAGNALEDYQKAEKAYKDKDYPKAVGMFDSYLQRYPKTDVADKAQFLKAYCVYQVAEKDKKPESYKNAIAELDKVQADYPSSTWVPYALHNQAAAYLKLGDTARATQLLEDLVKNYPLSPAAESARTRLNQLKGN